MLRNPGRLTPVFVLGAALFVESSVQAQCPPADTQPGYRAKQVLGSKMQIQGNIQIGTVDDIVFADDGQVEYLVVVNEGKLVAVPWEAAKFNFEQRTAIVNITQEQYRVIPTFTVERYPAFLRRLTERRCMAITDSNPATSGARRSSTRRQ